MSGKERIDDADLVGDGRQGSRQIEKLLALEIPGSGAKDRDASRTLHRCRVFGRQFNRSDRKHDVHCARRIA
jgi:hypothetical protein